MFRERGVGALLLRVSTKKQSPSEGVCYCPQELLGLGPQAHRAAWGQSRYWGQRSAFDMPRLSDRLAIPQWGQGGVGSSAPKFKERRSRWREKFQEESSGER